MSFLTRVVPAQSAVAGQAYRSFSTTLITQKGPIEAAKDVLKKADRAVSDAAVKGIETGEVLTEKAQKTIGVKTKEAEGKTKKMAGEAKGKAHELEGKAKGKAEELRQGQ